MKELTKEQVLHVANLARLNISEEEIQKYGEQLRDILTEIDKINKVEVTGDILISPTKNSNLYNDDVVGEMLEKSDVFKNAKNNDGEYIIVPKVIDND